MTYVASASLLLAFVSELYAGPFVLGVAARSDFNGDGIVDLQDVTLFRAHFGGDDPLFDLDGDGRVTLRDFFIFADDFVRHDPLAFLVDVATERTIIETDLMLMEVGHGPPFGISSLRLKSHDFEFAHSELPLADWEWLWVTLDDSLLTIKLLDQAWPAPEIIRDPDCLVVTFSMNGLFSMDVDAKVVFTVPRDRAGFSVDYTTQNNSTASLKAPYAMIGFPGFSNQLLVNEVNLVERAAYSVHPHPNFRAEGITRNKEYRLLGHSVLGVKMDPLTSAVVANLDDRSYRLSTTFFPPGDLTKWLAKHVNKPSYLTSHMYVTMPNLDAGRERVLTVSYELGVETDR